MKILVDEMPCWPRDCPFAKRPEAVQLRDRDVWVCSLWTVTPDGHRVHCVCKPAFCDHLKEVSVNE